MHDIITQRVFLLFTALLLGLGLPTISPVAAQQSINLSLIHI